jgi:hypothetical protein
MPQALHTMGLDLEPWRHCGLSRAPQLSHGPAHGLADFLALPPQLFLATAALLCVARLVLQLAAATAAMWLIGFL